MLGLRPISSAPIGAYGAAIARPSAAFSWPMMWAGDGLPIGFTDTDAGDRLGVVTPGVSAWSDNPALCLADFMRRKGNLTVDANYTAAAANYCDELVTGAAGTEKRARLTLALTQKKTVRDWIEAMRAYVPAWVVDAGDAWRIVADMPRAVDHVFGPGSIDGDSPPEITRTGTRDTPNAVEVVYTDEQQTPWETNGAFAEIAGVEDQRISRVELPGIRRYSQAYRFAVERLNHYTLEDIVGRMSIFDYGLKVLPGDVAQVSEAAFGWSAKPVRVLDATDKGNGRWDIEFREYDPVIYSDLVQTAPSIPNTGLSSPLEVLPALNLLVVEVIKPEAERANDGTGTSLIYQSRIRVTWDESPDPYLAGYYVRVFAGAEEVTGSPVPPGVGSWLSQPVVQLVEYRVELYAVNSLNVQSPAASALITIGGKVTVPSDVPAITQAIEIGGEVLLTWLPAADFDAIRYEWRVDLGNTGQPWDGMTVVDAVDGLRARFRGIPEGTHRFCVRALDSVGHYSANSKCVVLTVTSDEDAYLRNARFTLPTLVLMRRSDVPHDEQESAALRPRWLTNDPARSWDANMPSPIDSGTLAVFAYGIGPAGVATWRGEAFDMGLELTASFRLVDAVTAFTGAVTKFIEHSLDGVTWTQEDVTAGISWIGSARFVRPFYTGAAGTAYMIEGAPVIQIVSNPTRETGQGTSSASTFTRITLNTRYTHAVAITVTPVSATPAYATVDNVVVGLVAPNTFDVYIFDTTGVQVSRPFSWVFEGV